MGPSAGGKLEDRARCQSIQESCAGFTTPLHPFFSFIHLFCTLLLSFHPQFNAKTVAVIVQ